MTEYTLSALRCEIIQVDPGDGEIQNLIEIEVAVLRDTVEIDRFDQRYGLDVENTELRQHILYRVKEIIAADYDELERKTNKDRCTAIAANVESWSANLP